MTEYHYTLHFDGSCEPRNPGGTAAYGWVFRNPQGILVKKGSGVHCRGPGATNNVAEYAGLVNGLLYLKREGWRFPLVCYGDSKLVVMQVCGRWRSKKPHLTLLRDKALALLAEVATEWEIWWVPREANGEADSLSRV